MKKVACFVALAAILPAAAWADCSYPKKPDKAPSGAKATHAEMVTGKKTQDKYQADVTSYLKCLETQYNADVAKIDPAKSDKDKEKEKTKLHDDWGKKNDAAMDEAQKYADLFNEQRNICLARADACKK